MHIVSSRVLSSHEPLCYNTDDWDLLKEVTSTMGSITGYLIIKSYNRSPERSTTLIIFFLTLSPRKSPAKADGMLSRPCEMSSTTWCPFLKLIGSCGYQIRIPVLNIGRYLVFCLLPIRYGEIVRPYLLQQKTADICDKSPDMSRRKIGRYEFILIEFIFLTYQHWTQTRLITQLYRCFLQH